MGVAFQGDGTGTFRMLCACCERREKHINQPQLYAGIEWVFIGEPEPEEVEKIEPEPVEIESPQMSLFA
jgi:hypothetical protein